MIIMLIVNLNSLSPASTHPEPIREGLRSRKNKNKNKKKGERERESLFYSTKREVANVLFANKH